MHSWTADEQCPNVLRATPAHNSNSCTCYQIQKHYQRRNNLDRDLHRAAEAKLVDVQLRLDSAAASDSIEHV